MDESNEGHDKYKEKKMDYKKLAIQIASAEDPYGDFAKEASSLDDVHKTTLAREVNKQFFISRLDNKDGDGHIEFDIIEPQIIGTHANKSVGDPTIEKVASDNGVAITDKRSLVNDSMFVVAPRSTITSSSSNRGSEANFRKTAEHIIDSELDKEATEEHRVFTNNKSRAIAVLNDMFGAEVENITKMANDASELRGIMGKVIESGLGGIVSEMMAITNDAQSTLLKVASVNMDEDRTQALYASIEALNEISETKRLVKEASSQSDLEKIAILPTVVGGLTNVGFKAAKGVVNVAKTVGKAGWGLSKILGGTAGAGTKSVGNFIKGKSPIKGIKEGYLNGSGIAGGLATAALVGGTVLQVGPAMDKYQDMTLRT